MPNSLAKPIQAKCKRCNGTPRLVHKILNPRTGGALCMYKCECGEQIWIEHPK